MIWRTRDTYAKNRIDELNVNMCLPREDGFTRNSVSSVLKVRGFQTGRLPIRLTGYKSQQPDNEPAKKSVKKYFRLLTNPPRACKLPSD